MSFSMRNKSIQFNKNVVIPDLPRTGTICTLEEAASMSNEHGIIIGKIIFIYPLQRPSFKQNCYIRIMVLKELISNGAKKFRVVLMDNIARDLMVTEIFIGCLMAFYNPVITENRFLLENEDLYPKYQIIIGIRYSDCLQNIYIMSGMEWESANDVFSTCKDGFSNCEAKQIGISDTTEESIEMNSSTDESYSTSSSVKKRNTYAFNSSKVKRLKNGKQLVCFDSESDSSAINGNLVTEDIIEDIAVNNAVVEDAVPRQMDNEISFTKNSVPAVLNDQKKTIEFDSETSNSWELKDSDTEDFNIFLNASNKPDVVYKRSHEYIYVTLNKLEAGSFYNVYGIIKFVEQEKVLRNKKFYNTILITDETMPEGFCVGIFYQTDEDLPELQEGFIIRFHDMKVERNEFALDGRVFDSHQIITFNPRNEDVIYSTAKQIFYTDTDVKRVNELFDFVIKRTILKMELLKLEDTTFSLNCEVIGTKEFTLEETLVLRVQDGTICSVACSYIPFNCETLCQALDKSVHYDGYSDKIDVIVSEYTDKFKTLTKGDKIRLFKISSIVSNENVEQKKSSKLRFYMNGSEKNLMIIEKSN